MKAVNGPNDGGSKHDMLVRLQEVKGIDYNIQDIVRRYILFDVTFD